MKRHCLETPFFFRKILHQLLSLQYKYSALFSLRYCRRSRGRSLLFLNFKLTNYLEYFHKNNEAFAQYLNWRRKPFEEEFSNQLEYRANNGHCQLYSKLYDLDSNSAYKVTSLHEWWIKSNSPYCVDSKYFAVSSSKFFYSRLEWLSLKIFSSFPTILMKPYDFFSFFKVTLELFLCLIFLIAACIKN